MEDLNINDFLKMIEAACNNLKKNYKTIDSNNYYPVDNKNTGYNLFITFSSSFEELSLIDCSLNELIYNFYKLLSKNACGTSGLIISQLFKGLYLSVYDKKNINVYDVAKGFVYGSYLANLGVIHQIEGMMLSSMNHSFNYSLKQLKNDDNFYDYFLNISKYLKKELKLSKEKLPILKFQDCYDSGTLGLLYIFDGFLTYFKKKNK